MEQFVRNSNCFLNDSVNETQFHEHPTSLVISSPVIRSEMIGRIRMRSGRFT